MSDIVTMMIIDYLYMYLWTSLSGDVAFLYRIPRGKISSRLPCQIRICMLVALERGCSVALSAGWLILWMKNPATP